MASAAPLPRVAPSFASSKKAANYARLCRLLVDVGTEVLRKIFDRLCPPEALWKVLTSPSVMSELQSLKGRRVINPLQWEKLFPSSKHKVSSTEFDITLLMVLVRNICNLAPPSTGWDSLPPATDISMQADIARIKYYRNTVYGHANKASLHDTEYYTYWQEIKDTLVRLGGQQYENTINDLETVCMDPETEGKFQDLLRQWVKDDENIKDKIDEIGENLGRKLEDVREEVASISMLGENTLKKFEQMIQHVIEKLDVMKAENTTDKLEMEDKLRVVNEKLHGLMISKEQNKGEETMTDKLQQMESQLTNVLEKLDTFIPPKGEMKDEDNVPEKLQQIENYVKVFVDKFDAIFLADQLRAPSVLDSSHKGDESISSIQDYGSGNPSIESSLYTSMDAQVDSLGSVSTYSVFSGASIGAIANCPIQVKNEFHGNVNFNIYRQNDKQDTDKD